MGVCSVCVYVVCVGVCVVGGCGCGVCEGGLLFIRKCNSMEFVHDRQTGVCMDAGKDKTFYPAII